MKNLPDIYGYSKPYYRCAVDPANIAYEMWKAGQADLVSDLEGNQNVQTYTFATFIGNNLGRNALENIALFGGDNVNQKPQDVLTPQCDSGHEPPCGSFLPPPKATNNFYDINNAYQFTEKVYSLVTDRLYSIFKENSCNFNLEVDYTALPSPTTVKQIINTFEVINELSGSRRSFASRTTAINALGRIRAMPVANSGCPSVSWQCALFMRVALDRERLPLPLRPVAYTRLDWYLSSRWKQWPLTS